MTDEFPSQESHIGPIAPLNARTLGQRRVLAIVEMLLCSSIPTQLFLQALLVAFGWHPLNPDRSYSLSFVVTMSVLDTILLIALMVFLTRAHGQSVAELWLGRRTVWKETILGVSFIPVVLMIVVVLLTTIRLFVPALHNVETNPLEKMATGGAMNAAAFAAVGILAGGVREEMQRAFLLRRFDLLGGEVVGAVLLSIAFGLGHAVQGWDAAVTTGVLGGVWAVIYLWRRSSIAAIVSHAGFNAIEVLRIAMVGG